MTLPLRPCRLPRLLRSAPRLGAPLVGLVALSLLVRCGASGAGNDGTVQVQDRDGDGIPDPPSDGLPPGVSEECVGLTCGLGGVDGPLMAPPGCGDGVRTDDEACDDGNRVSGDGCAEHCLSTEPGFSCATPGQPCRQIARCGDGIVAQTEQCDDGNTDSNDGCSNRCRVELGSKCEGEPSVCTATVCGDGIQEGAEACDDGNTSPFDGCSPICLKEPNCEGSSCTSECGDGLVINEDCDDGNRIDGDGCSSNCTIESGFNCDQQAACELIGGQCALRVSAIFRDFSGTHPDFTEGNNARCTTLAPGAVATNLDANRRPVLVANPPAAACMSTPQNFADWYTSNERNVTVVGELVLFDNGQGGYVNRFGAEGQQFAVPDPTTERNPTGSLQACGNACRQEANNALQCQNTCRPPAEDAQQLQNGQLIQLTNQLNQAENAAVPDPDLIAALEAQIADVVAQIAALNAEAAECLDDCQAEIESRTATCSSTCKPCSFNPAQFCIGGVLQSTDGNPLFFPLDAVRGPTYDPAPARVPDNYGTIGFPAEGALFPNLSNEQLQHNFKFTSEVQYWFKYDTTTNATLTFLGDDDVWVFLNGRLAVDLGGIHVPSTGVLTINAAAGTVTTRLQDGREQNGQPVSPPININATTADFGLEDGGVYTISIFHAERKLDGSSFQLTLAGFEATPSDCSAICGDGVLSFGEECDDGVNDGGYGECNPGCVLGPFCGDGVEQPEFGESCDVGPISTGTCRGCRISRIQ